MNAMMIPNSTPFVQKEKKKKKKKNHNSPDFEAKA
jgi:hypothetical protein